MHKKKYRGGIPGKIKKRTLVRVGEIFFKHVSVEAWPGLDREVWLICSGLRLKKDDLVDTLDYGRINEHRAVYLASHFLQAYLRTEFGLAVDTPIKDGKTYQFLICY